MSKFYYGDRVRVSNTYTVDRACGTVVGKVKARGGYALTKEGSNSNKESSDAFNYLVKLDNISSAYYTIHGKNCNYIWGHASDNADCIIVKENEMEHLQDYFSKNIILEFNEHTITVQRLEEYEQFIKNMLVILINKKAEDIQLVTKLLHVYILQKINKK